VIAAVLVDGDGAEVRGSLRPRLRVERDGGVERLQRRAVVAAVPMGHSQAHELPRALGDRSRMSQRERTVPLRPWQALSQRFVEVLGIHRLFHRSGHSSFPKTPEFLVRSRP
jgi:hypothetical protein